MIFALVLFLQLGFAQASKDSQTPLQDAIPSQVCEISSSEMGSLGLLMLDWC